MTIQEAEKIITPIYDKYKMRLEMDGPVGFQIMMSSGSEPHVGFKVYDADQKFRKLLLTS